MAQGKVFLQPCGADGRPLLVIRINQHRPVNDIAQVERFVVYCLEAASALCDHPGNPDGKLWALFDVVGVKWANMDAHALMSCFKLLNDAFPERVSTIWMLNSPGIFNSLWRMVRPFIDPVSRDKVRFVAGPDGTSLLLGSVDPEIVPVAYGGAAEEVPVEAAVAAWRRRRAGAAGTKDLTAERDADGDDFWDAEEFHDEP